MSCSRRLFRQRTSSLVLWMYLILFALVFLSSAIAAVQPNVVFILVDDLGWADVGCYESTFYRTPNIDRLAVDGMRFSDAYAASLACSPTRASILTGKYPARLHLTDWLPGRQDRPSQKLLKPDTQRHLPLEELTLAEALKPLGYTSASIGKWHLGGLGFGPLQQGFDLNIAGDESGSPLTYFAPFRKGAHVMPGLESSKPGEYLTDRLTDEALKFMEMNRDGPFFLYLSHYAVHIPLEAKQSLIAHFRDRPAAGPQTNAIYAAMIESVDESVGRILQKLDELRLTDRTLVIFTSDNGGLSVKEGPNTPATSNAPLRAGKGFLYEGGMRVPLIVRWPGTVSAGTLERTPVSSIDFLPTILAAVGAPARSGIDGLDLCPVLRQTEPLRRKALYWHYPHYSNQGGLPGGVIREGRFKLLQFFEDGRLELYDLAQDLAEHHNLASAQPERAAALLVGLEQWRKSQDAQMMEPNPEYQPGNN